MYVDVGGGGGGVAGGRRTSCQKVVAGPSDRVEPGGPRVAAASQDPGRSSCE